MDELVKGRHSGENRSPSVINMKIAPASRRTDSGFRRNDWKGYFPAFYEPIQIKCSHIFY
jgi:hypothetical protein